MAQPLNVEYTDIAFLGTTRTNNSKLWFIYNKKLENEVLGYLAKYQEKYKLIIYAFSIMGNHYHLVAQFPLGNKASFYRDFNARWAEIVKRNVDNYPGGHLWERRYSAQATPGGDSVEKEFFYCALQPVAAGLSMKISDYRGYLSFSDAVSGCTRKYKLVEWSAYHSAKRYTPNLHSKHFTKEYTLTYSRVPGYESMSSSEYKKMMLEKLEKKRVEEINKRKEEGLGFCNVDTVEQFSPGDVPKTTKKSSRDSFRPLVLSPSKKVKEEFLDSYFAIKLCYDDASARYRAGEENVEFPPGTYKPPNFLIETTKFEILS